MITIFTCPKKFEGIFEVIQRNAIKSWLNLDCEKEIIVLGDEKGVTEICKEFGLKHIPTIENFNGIPLMSSIFKKAEENAFYDILMFINTDILFFGDIKKVISLCQKNFDKFILIGPRVNYDIESDIDFNDVNFINQLLNLKSNVIFAQDYFIFPKNTFRYFPDFLIGRPFWDSWICYYAEKNKIPLIDVGLHLKAIHQNHPYSFKTFPSEEAVRNKEIRWNFKLSGFGAVYESQFPEYVLDKNFNLIKHKSKIRKFAYYLAKYIYLNLAFNLPPKFVKILFFLKNKIKPLITRKYN